MKADKLNGRVIYIQQDVFDDLNVFGLDFIGQFLQNILSDISVFQCCTLHMTS
jgi:hypothetical protein